MAAGSVGHSTLSGQRIFPWLGHYLVPLGGVAFAIGIALTFLPRAGNSEWRQTFVQAALRMQRGESIHVLEPEAYAYPPAMAMLTIPLANLPPRLAMAGWCAVNVLACAVIFYCAWKLVGGQRWLGLDRRWLSILAVGMALSLRYVLIGLGHQGFDAVIAALLLSGCYGLWRGRDLAGGALLGVAAAMKCTPLLFAPYLVWRGKWRTAILMSATAVGLNVLPDLAWPQSPGRWYLTDWNETFLAGTRSWAPGAWFVSIHHNQSLAGLFNRYYQFGLPWNYVEDSERILTGVEARGLKIAVYVAALGLLAVTAWRCGGIGRPAPTVAAGGDEPKLEHLQTGFEAGALMALMLLLLSPMSSLSHYVVLVLPSLLIARLVVDGQVPAMRWIAVGMLVCGPLASKGLLGRHLGTLARVWGMPTWFVLLALLAMWLALAEIRRRREKVGAGSFDQAWRAAA